MLNCSYLAYNEAIVFNSIVEEKNEPGKSVLRAISNRVLTQYNNYVNNFQLIDQNKKSAFLPAEKDQINAMKLCYNSATASFAIIRGNIFSNQPIQLKNLCPYCLLDRPRTLDHYISQTEFPEYSILVKNLIPCCYDCNNKKGENWRKNGRRRFLHFYNDTFFKQQFLFGNLVVPRSGIGPRINFELRNPGHFTSNQFRLIRTHFRDLNLLNEYTERAGPFLSSEVAIIKESLGGGQSVQIIKDTLQIRYNSKLAEMGINFWQTILYGILFNDNRVFNL